MSAYTECPKCGDFYTRCRSCDTAELAVLRARVAELEVWAKEVLDHTPADAFPGYIDLSILDPKP